MTEEPELLRIFDPRLEPGESWTNPGPVATRLRKLTPEGWVVIWLQPWSLTYGPPRPVDGGGRTKQKAAA